MKITLSTLLTALVALSLLGPGIASEQHDDAHAGPTMNYHEIDHRLATGGHFVDDGLDDVRDKGIKVVIDLRDKPPAGQKEKLAGAGIEWINVPVVWKDPKPGDFERFVEVMSQHDGDNVLVQCQGNYRASAMTYLYRVLVADVPEAAARKDLNAVWEPEGRWREYMDSIIDSHDGQ